MKNLQIIPDINFINKLKDLFPEAFENELLDINNGKIINSKELYVTGLNIKDLTGIEYFVNLEVLNCYVNQLTTLPELPDTLEKLYCFNNQLTNLPNLPGTLEYLDCSNNILTSLPNLPKRLKDLSCSNNQLTTLPKLPSILRYLVSMGNKVLPPARLPKNLSYFRWSICYRNKNNQVEGECLEYKLIK